MPKRLTPWERFKANTEPLAKVREIKAALPDGPGLPALYREVKEHQTVLGVPALIVGRNVFVPRRRIVERIEGAIEIAR
mgnify:CR=1 FL=1